jgi:hypothetical protein
MNTTPRQVLTLEMIRERCTHCGECWEYHGRRHPQVKHEGQHKLLRRLIYELHHGKPIQEGRRILPTCGNVLCVAPDHIKAMTESQKGKQAAARGAFSSPVRGKRIAEQRRLTLAKLTLEQAQEIRCSSESGPVLAERFGINKSRVNAIKRGDAWKDYSSPWAGLGA